MNAKSQILTALKRHQRLTGLDAVRRFGTLKLASRVSELRAEGHPIRDESVKLRSGKRVKRYWMGRKAA